jgi:futalosine hydrolase
LQNKMIREKFLPDIESMEGAAFHYVCLQQKNNFLQLRSISNRVGERDKSKWKLKESIENLNKELLKIIENF